LADVGVVRGGYSGADAVSDRPGPTHLRALQARDVSDNGHIDWSKLSYSSPARDAGRYMIRNGDVLLPLRSLRPRAIVTRDVPPEVIAAGQWAVITPTPDAVRPDYLAWFLNHPDTATRLNRLGQGGTLPFISLVALRDFEIAVPPIDVQDRIARVHALQQRLISLERHLAEARSVLIDAVTMASVRRYSSPSTTVNHHV
jgi:hypothetical protein